MSTISKKICGLIAGVSMLTVSSVLSAGVISPGKLPDDFDLDKLEDRPITEVVPRAGLPNFFGKLKRRAPEVTIAYFGGSITEQDGYRVFSADYLQRMYPDTKIKSVHAAIGGTDSELGAFRAGHDVISGKPDLVLVEFAVNDWRRGPYPITRSMEGIVRQIWKSDPSCDIMFVYTVVDRDWVNTGYGAKQKREVNIMEHLADYYGIPSVDFSKEVLRLVAEDKLVMKSSKDEMSVVAGDSLNLKSGEGAGNGIPVNADGRIPFAGDGVHPHLDTGHVIYEAALERSWPVIMAAGGAPGPHALPAPILKNCLETVVSVPVDDSRIVLSGDFRRDPADDPVTSGFLNRFNPFFSFRPGAEIVFRFQGSKAALYSLFGPSCGTVEYSVDGCAPVKRVMFDGYSRYHRLVLMHLADGLDPEKIHEIRIRVLDEPFDKREALFAENREYYDQHPGEFVPRIFYAGCVFAVGKLAEPGR